MNKADILTRVNKITGRAETDIDDVLLEVLTDIARRTLCLETSTTGVTVSGQGYIDTPSDMATPAVDGLEVDGSVLNPITWQDWLQDIQAGYTYRGSKLYLRPIPTANGTYTLYYTRLHPSDLDTILFPDTFLPAVQYGVASKVYEKYEIMDKSNEQYTKYEIELKKLSGDGVYVPHQTPRQAVRL